MLCKYTVLKMKMSTLPIDLVNVFHAYVSLSALEISFFLISLPIQTSATYFDPVPLSIFSYFSFS